MAWNTPITWVAGQLVGASDLNGQIRDDLLYLLSGRGFINNAVLPAGNYTTSSSTFVVVDTTNLSVTIYTQSGRLLIQCAFAAGTDNTAHTSQAWFSQQIDGVTIDGSATYGSYSLKQTNGGNGNHQICLLGGGNYGVGTHTIKLVYRGDGTAGDLVTIYGGATQPIRPTGLEQ